MNERGELEGERGGEGREMEEEMGGEGRDESRRDSRRL